MANTSDSGESNKPSLQDYALATSAVKLASLILITGVSVLGNVLISLLVIKDRALHKVAYYFLLNLCLGDMARSVSCFPFVMVSLSHGLAWDYNSTSCKAVAFLSALFCFHAAFTLFGVSVTRYMAIAHHRFYAKRVTPWTCAAVIGVSWILATAMALPPVFDMGTYTFMQQEEQCTFEQRYARANDTLGFTLMLAVVVATTHAVYVKMLCFVYDHRKMKPAQIIPAVSHNWTFHGPGATGQAAANWIAGFGRGPTPPTLVGIRQVVYSTNRRLLVLDEFKTEKRISKMYYMVTLAFLLLWAPYIVLCYAQVLVKGSGVPRVYVSAAVWLTFAQAAANPLICLVFNKELRTRCRACFPCCLARSTQTPTEPYCVILNK